MPACETYQACHMSHEKPWNPVYHYNNLESLLDNNSLHKASHGTVQEWSALKMIFYSSVILALIPPCKADWVLCLADA